MSGTPTELEAADEMPSGALGWAWAWIVAGCGVLAVLATINDPGLTVDEPINVGHGKEMVYVLFHRPADFLKGETVDSLWRNGHEHPPLCRFLIGLAHALTDGQPNDPSAILPKAGRPIGALAFGGLILLCIDIGSRIGGRNAGVAAGLFVAFMPRMFAHAHLASPEVISSMFFLLALRSALKTFGGASPPLGSKASLATGFWVGVALLAKLTNVLLIPIIAIYALYRFRAAAIAPIVIAGGTALAVLCCGWPWFWPLDIPGYAHGFAGTAQRLRDFFNVGLDRATVYVWYFGKQYPNVDSKVPWHFAWVFFGATIPLVTLAFGLIGMIAGRAESPAWRRAAGLLVCAVFGTLLFFSLPIERYDSERLFLFAFAPFAIFAGLGFAQIAERIETLVGMRLSWLLLPAMFMAPVYDIVVLHPVQLSFFNYFVGGLSGADRHGLEVTYWGDSLTESFLNRCATHIPQGSEVVLLPTLYPGHAVYLTTQPMRDLKIVVVPGDRFVKGRTRHAILFNRAGYVHDPLPTAIMTSGRVVEELQRNDVWMARLYELTPEPITPNPNPPIPSR